MRRLGSAPLRWALDTMRWTGCNSLLRPFTQGAGIIFTLHHVRPAAPNRAFAPNAILDITPEFLDAVITRVIGLGIDIVDLDEAASRLGDPDAKRFAVFTLDDGYRDNLEVALPIFRRHNAPCTVYVTTGIVDASAVMWWVHLADVIRDNDSVCYRHNGALRRLDTSTVQAKWKAHDELYWLVRGLPTGAQEEVIADLIDDYGLDPVETCRAVALDDAALLRLAGDPLVDIGAHTVSHRALSKLPRHEVVRELTEATSELERRLDREIRHACYPYGDRSSAGPREFLVARELGFATATTTRKGVLFAEHQHHLHALPRVSLNGDYQRIRYVDAYLSGAPFALMHRFRRLDVGGECLPV